MSLSEGDHLEFILRNNSVTNSDNDEYWLENNRSTSSIINAFLTNNHNLTHKVHDLLFEQEQNQYQHQHQYQHKHQQASALFILLSVILSTLVVCTFIGNLFVMIAILVDKNLQTAANLLVLSLAVADFMVACLVMPLGAYNDLYQGWFLGTKICEFWTSADVLCCTGKFCLVC